jgi:uncharacterized membrane protein
MWMYLGALLLGVVAGLRTMTPLAAVSWAAHFDVIEVADTRLAFLRNDFVMWLFTIAALLELVADQLPSTPSRKVFVAFLARLVVGALCGAAVTITPGLWPVGAFIGFVGAFIGTEAGAAIRKRLAFAFHRDRPAAFLEDAVAVGGAALIVGLLH